MLYTTKSEDAARLQIRSGEEATKKTDQHNSMLPKGGIIMATPWPSEE
jgi:hypothetical protein